jgi:2-polyprenyl-3-methyl-5-hydroxy-6-metoxy-1,4-benzoquinol methylase
MQFDFGRNWIAFSKLALTSEMVDRARGEFTQLFKDVPISGKSFLDIGFGQGLSLLFAKQAGASVWGNDINPKCKEALALTASIMKSDPDVQVVIGSILDETVVKRLKGISPKQNGFDVVHSWGVLHHTGDMKAAMHNAATLVAKNGYLVVALYNRHYTSKLWLAIKWLYGKSPRPLKTLFTVALIPVIALAKFIATGKNPFAQNRGMHFYYNVIDWIGGYPYEYASEDEVIALLTPEGFSCCAFIPAQVPTGCNEFVFKKKVDHA